MNVAVTSGGFDPVHVGHLALFVAARQFGSVWVILNNDAWLMQKKGYVFMPEDDRKAILEELRIVDRVVLSKHGSHPSDMSVCAAIAAIQRLSPEHSFTFCNGGDRDHTNTPESALCAQLGWNVAYGVGGGKVASSSALVAEADSLRRQRCQ